MNAVSCPHCRKLLEVDCSLAGQAVRCPHCGRSLVVPKKAEAPDAQSEGIPTAILVLMLVAGHFLVMLILGLMIGLGLSIALVLLAAVIETAIWQRRRIAELIPSAPARDLVDGARQQVSEPLEHKPAGAREDEERIGGPEAVAGATSDPRHIFRSQQYGYRVLQPSPGWFRYDRSEEERLGADMILEERSLGALRIEVQEPCIAPEHLAERMERAVRAKVVDVQFGASGNANIGGYPARYIEYEGTLPELQGQRMRFLTYVFTRGNTGFTLTAAAIRTDTFAEFEADVERMLESFAFESTGPDSAAGRRRPTSATRDVFGAFETNNAFLACVANGMRDAVRHAHVIVPAAMLVGMLTAMSAAFCFLPCLVVGPALLCGFWALALSVVRREGRPFGRMLWVSVNRFIPASLLAFGLLIRFGVAGVIAVVLGLIIGVMFGETYGTRVFGLIVFATLFVAAHRIFAFPVLVEADLPVDASLQRSDHLTSVLGGGWFGWFLFCCFNGLMWVCLSIPFMLLLSLGYHGLLHLVMESATSEEAAGGALTMMMGLLFVLVAGAWGVAMMPFVHAYDVACRWSDGAPNVPLVASKWVLMVSGAIALTGAVCVMIIVVALMSVPG